LGATAAWSSGALLLLLLLLLLHSIEIYHASSKASIAWH
jgi:hypothetical protein